MREIAYFSSPVVFDYIKGLFGSLLGTFLESQVLIPLIFQSVVGDLQRNIGFLGRRTLHVHSQCLFLTKLILILRITELLPFPL